MQFWPILGPYDPLRGPLQYQRSTFKGSYFPKMLHKIVLPKNGLISTSFEVKMLEKCPKCHISCSFGQFWDHMTHSEAPYSTDIVTFNGSYSPKILQKIVLPENGFISIFYEVKMLEKCPKCHISCNFGQLVELVRIT